MSNVSDLVDMLVPPNEFGETDMTPEILNQITAIQDAVCDALDLPRRPTIHLTTLNKFRHVTRPDNRSPVASLPPGRISSDSDQFDRSLFPFL
jgi:hypothetical protein